MYSSLDIAKYFIRCTNSEVEGTITNLKLQKLLYYAQGLYLALYNRPLYSEEVKAWQYGPVVEQIYREFKSFSRNPIPDCENFDAQIINNTDREFLDEVYSVYGQYTGTALINLTHQESPWKNTNINEVITHQLMKDYFQDKVSV